MRRSVKSPLRNMDCKKREIKRTPALSEIDTHPLPSNWKELIHNTLPKFLQEEWILAAPTNPSIFELVIALYSQSENNLEHFGVSSSEGVEWFDEYEDAEQRRQQLKRDGKKGR